MKRKNLVILLAFAGISIILGGCVPGPRVQGAPGISMTEESIFVAYDFFVYQMNVETKVVEWSYPSEANNKIKFFAQPLVTDEYLYIGDVNNTFHKVNIETGDDVWVFSKAKGFFMGPPAEENSIVYAPSNDGFLYAIDSNGNELWKFETGHYIWAQPQLSDEVVYLASMDHFVYAVSKSDGEKLWEFEMNGAIPKSFTLSDDGNTLFVGSIGKDFVALDTQAANDDDRVLWRFDANGELASIWGESIYTDNTIYFADSSGKVFALDAETGESVWQTPVEFSGTIIGGLGEHQEGFAFATEEGEIRSYRFDGSLIWSKSVEGEIFQAPVFNKSYVAVGVIGGDELIYLYDLKGNLVWSNTPEK